MVRCCAGFPSYQLSLGGRALFHVISRRAFATAPTLAVGFIRIVGSRNFVSLFEATNRLTHARTPTLARILSHTHTHTYTVRKGQTKPQTNYNR